MLYHVRYHHCRGSKATYICLVFHDELLHDLPGDDVLDLDGEHVRQVEGDVTESHDGRDERFAALGRQIVLHHLEDVGENNVLKRNAKGTTSFTTCGRPKCSGILNKPCA